MPGLRFAVLILLSVIPSAVFAAKPHLVMLIAEREYLTEQTLPAFASEHLADDYRVTFVFAAPEDRNRLVGVEAVASADILLVSVRRRTLPVDQLKRIREYVEAGKPVIGIRTANHAFSINGKPVPEGRAVWDEWDQRVFGGNYRGHHGNRLKTTVTFAAGDHPPLLRDLHTKPFAAGGSLYRVSPLADGASIILRGRVEGHSPEPVAWSFVRSDGGRSFYTSLGHVDDFRGEVLPRLLVNALAWVVEP